MSEVPVGRRAHRGNGLQRWLAAWFAAVLAIAPFVRPSLPGALPAARAASPEALVAHAGAEDKQPAAELRPDRPLTLGILSRLSALETTFGLPSVKPPLLRPTPEQPALARQAMTAPGAELRGVFQRSSVGTARIPTGPPS
jgi:hypothetical protein